MVGVVAKRSGPELGCSNVRCVDDPLVCTLVQDGRSFETGHVRSMSHLCLSVASHHLHGVDLGKDLGSLLFTCQESQCPIEHTEMHCNGATSQMEVLKQSKSIGVGFIEVVFAVNLSQNIHLLPPVCHLLLSRHVVVIEV